MPYANKEDRNKWYRRKTYQTRLKRDLNRARRILYNDLSDSDSDLEQIPTVTLSRQELDSMAASDSDTDPTPEIQETEPVNCLSNSSDSSEGHNSDIEGDDEPPIIVPVDENPRVPPPVDNPVLPPAAVDSPPPLGG